jgi:hypothetical protein
MQDPAMQAVEARQQRRQHGARQGQRYVVEIGIERIKWAGEADDLDVARVYGVPNVAIVTLADAGPVHLDQIVIHPLARDQTLGSGEVLRLGRGMNNQGIAERRGAGLGSEILARVT